MAVLFRLRASLHFTSAGLAAWARDQNTVRVAMARPVSPGTPREEPVVNSLKQGHFVADLPFEDRALAEDTWAALLAIVDAGQVQEPTPTTWSGMNLHVCHNEPSQPCEEFLGVWSNRMPDQPEPGAVV